MMRPISINTSITVNAWGRPQISITLATPKEVTPAITLETTLVVAVNEWAAKALVTNGVKAVVAVDCM